MTAKSASELDSSRLDCRVGDPLLHVERLYVDAAGRAVEWAALSVIHALERAIIDAAEQSAADHGVTAGYGRRSISERVALNSELQSLIELSARNGGLSIHRLASGAGHDSQSMASITPTGMIFVPSVGGRSHCPEELSTWTDIKGGANVLLDAVVALASDQ